MRIPSLLRWLAPTLVMVSPASAQGTPASSIGFMGAGYGLGLEQRHYAVAPGGVINFYFTGVPFAAGGNAATLSGEWPDELWGHALEFQIKDQPVRGRLGRLAQSNICDPGRLPAEFPAADIALPCILTMITTQVPWEAFAGGSSLNSTGPRSVRVTLVTPLGRSRPVPIVVGLAMHLLSPAQFGLGREDDIGQFSQVYFENSSQPLRPGAQITLYAYGLDGPENPAPLGSPPGRPVAAPKSLVANFHFGVGFPILRVRPTFQDRYWDLPGQVEVEPDYIALVPGRVGVYEIRLTVPSPPRNIQIGDCVLPNLTVTLAAGIKFEGRFRRYDGGLTGGFQTCVKVSTEEEK